MIIMGMQEKYVLFICPIKDIRGFKQGNDMLSGVSGLYDSDQKHGGGQAPFWTCKAY